jgi:hypothetical protein
MRRVGIIVVAALLGPGLSTAQQQASFEPSDKASIDQLLDEYGQAFVAKAYSKLQETLQAPFVRLGPSITVNETAPGAGGWVVLRTMDEVMNFFRTSRDALDKQDFLAARSQFLDSRMTVLSADRALVNRTFRRNRRDGTVLLEAGAIYVVSKSSGRWKICGLFPQDFENFGKVY